MLGEAHGQTLEPALSQQLIAIQELNDKIAQLGKRNKPQGRRPQHEERRFGDAPEASYVESKPPDPSWNTPQQTSYTHDYLTHSYHNFKYTNDVKIYSFSGSTWPDDYLSWERTMDEWFSYHCVPRKERLSHAIKQLSGKAFSWWKRVDCSQEKSYGETIKTWEDLKDAMIRNKNESYMLTEVPRKEPDHKLSHEPPHKWKPKIEPSIVQMPRLKVSFSDLKRPKTLDYPGCKRAKLQRYPTRLSYVARRINSTEDQKRGHHKFEGPSPPEEMQWP
ncbi:hypothetical protein DY000_02012463 [Brassica cretica]|uniref:Retrotransposon gag domain-containing protein n=1 Tax=Brassica cretica TaxID=69181 RepID=A0ABQ7CNI2_BRACR|nr:hypothetical protein DY000_02012463 [Brassica cretica]